MKTKLSYYLILPLLFGLHSCDDKETLKTPPVVTTSSPSNITTTSVVIGGAITDSGHDEISKSGVVYSGNVAVPTIAESKVEATVTEGQFLVSITGLSSGTTYHVRAFATNSVGTSYGDVVDFTTGNSAPVISNVSIKGVPEVSKTVTADYSYKDSENDPEGATTFQWYVATSSSGADEIAIQGATEKTFTIQDEQNGRFLRVAVVPKAAAGTMVGVEVKSQYTTEIGAETVTFIYNKGTVTYGTITSAVTHKKWLDRNLGASRLAQAIDDYLAYGDLFQWGRLDDGHQLVARTGATDADASGTSGTTSATSPYETSVTDTPPTAKFIIRGGFGTGDWRKTPNNDLWQGVGAINNPCPEGWHIPTRDEWIAEGLTSGTDAFTKLKLPYTGKRDRFDGSFFFSTGGSYWASTRLEAPDEDGQLGAAFIFFKETTISTTGFDARAMGEACRCIKD